ncbi:MAG TPA: pyridoxamine 5'-phosphate oxidase family protein [Noviherbaspirillum sp.]|nr:pyridoxamine 5'-phosphate oxidase family protein [Noviherbaspirillum sp.]
MDSTRDTEPRRPAPFHAGEQLAQERAGVRAQMEKVGSVVLRNYMPEQHREFFPLLPTLFVGAEDEGGALWASMLWGEPGFIQSPDPAALRVEALFAGGDPLAASLKSGKSLGLLGLQFETRRRNRANGIASAVDNRGFSFILHQSFGNCPKYIQTREQVTRAELEPGVPLSGTGPLPEAALTLIRQADTFFIATASGAPSDGVHGIDVSHRGGRPGFVKAAAEGRLAWPDFQGNNFFNTIGNIAADGRAGLLFIDFTRGDLLHLSGRAEVDWDGDDVARVQGAKRVLRFATARYVFRPRALPLRWTPLEQSPHLEATGVW